MQDSLTMLCCGALFGVIALAIVMKLLKGRSVPSSPTSSTPAKKPKSVEGKRRVQRKSVEGKRHDEAKSAGEKRRTDEKPVGDKHRADAPRTKGVSQKHVAEKPSKSERHTVEPTGERSKSTHKQSEPEKPDRNDDNPRFRSK